MNLYAIETDGKITLDLVRANSRKEAREKFRDAILREDPEFLDGKCKDVTHFVKSLSITKVKFKRDVAFSI